MLSPTDAAWSVLEEGHRVEKILPAVLLGAAAAQGLRNAGFSFRDEEGDFAPGFSGSATVADPTGGMIASKEIEDPNALERGAAVATQVLPVGAGIKAVRSIGRSAKGALQGIRQADRAQAAARAANAEQAAQAAAAHARRLQMTQRATSRRPGAYRATNAEVDEAYRIAEDAAQIARNRRLAPAVPKTPRRGGKVAQATAFGVPLAVAGYHLGQSAIDALTPTPGPVQGFGAGGGMAPAQGGQQGFQLANQQAGGIGGVQNVGVSGMADHDIFQGVQWNQPQGPAPIQQNWPQQTNMQASSNVQTGMPMSLGNQLLKSALDAMQYNIMKENPCPKCGKKGCVSKMGCVAKAKCPHCDGDAPRSACICGKKEKAEGKGKKPAHGMVIVIGSKAAGPGPSTDGKRDDKKDKKE